MVLHYCSLPSPFRLADALRQPMQLAGAAILRYSMSHNCRKSTGAARRSIRDRCVVLRTKQLHWPTLRVVWRDWPVLRPCATVGPPRVANWPKLRTGRFATTVQALAPTNRICRRFMSADATGQCGVSAPRASTGAHTLTHLRMYPRTDIDTRVENCVIEMHAWRAPRVPNAFKEKGWKGSPSKARPYIVIFMGLI